MKRKGIAKILAFVMVIATVGGTCLTIYSLVASNTPNTQTDDGSIESINETSATVQIIDDSGKLNEIKLNGSYEDIKQLSENALTELKIEESLSNKSLYINNVLAEVPADTIMVNDGDVVRWE